MMKPLSLIVRYVMIRIALTTLILSIGTTTASIAQDEFKGLRLGMTLEELINLVDSTGWTWQDSASIALKDTAKQQYVLFLRPDKQMSGQVSYNANERESFRCVGCTIVGKDTICPQFDEAYVAVLDKKIYSIGIRAKSNLIQFADVVIDSLSQKYGKAKDLIWEKKRSIYSLKKHIALLARWKVENMDARVVYYWKKSGDYVILIFDFPEVINKIFMQN